MSLYPIQILQDRYGGTYSGGKWVAVSNANWNLEEVDNSINGDDVMARNYGDTIKDKKYVAVGDTPDEALKNLELKNPL